MISKKEILKIREKLKEAKERKNFWLKNKKNFEKNILKIFKILKKELKLEKKWKIYIVASNFLGKKVMPYDYDSFSSTNLIASTKQQGFEIMLFLNRTRLEFLSLPALIPLILHEFKHIKQAEKNPKNYLLSILNNKISRKLEKEAEKNEKNKKEFRKQVALESILYCYDIGKWKAAEKMADFLFAQDKLYGGGYEKGISKKEHEAFLEAKKKKDIKLFVKFYLGGC